MLFRSVLIGEFIFSDKKQTEKDLANKGNFFISDDEKNDENQDDIYNEESVYAEAGSGENTNVAGSSNIFSDTKEMKYIWIAGLCFFGGLAVASIKKRH